MNKLPRVTFHQFIEKFPLEKLPVTIHEESHFGFSQDNDPLPGNYIAEFMSDLEPEFDEYTEVVPCFRFEEEGQFYGIVYWRAKLMQYDYFLVTYTWKEELAEKVRIAGTSYKQDQVLISVAQINEDLIIDMMEGVGDVQSNYDSANSRSYYFEILENGKILNPKKAV